MCRAVWPSVAFKKLVGANPKITEEDLKKGYEANYGPRVRCRAIVLNNQRRPRSWEKARDNPSVENFAKLAEKYSVDQQASIARRRSAPIQRHGGQPLLEKEAFKLQPGEISGVIQVGETYIVMLLKGTETGQG